MPDKTEEEFRLYGRHCKPKVKSRGFSPAQQAILDKQGALRLTEETKEKVTLSKEEKLKKSLIKSLGKLVD